MLTDRHSFGATPAGIEVDGEQPDTELWLGDLVQVGERRLTQDEIKRIKKARADITLFLVVLVNVVGALLLPAVSSGPMAFCTVLAVEILLLAALWKLGRTFHSALHSSVLVFGNADDPDEEGTHQVLAKHGGLILYMAHEMDPKRIRRSIVKPIEFPVVFRQGRDLAPIEIEELRRYREKGERWAKLFWPSYFLLLLTPCPFLFFFPWQVMLVFSPLWIMLLVVLVRSAGSGDLAMRVLKKALTMPLLTEDLRRHDTWVLSGGLPWIEDGKPARWRRRKCLNQSVAELYRQGRIFL